MSQAVLDLSDVLEESIGEKAFFTDATPTQAFAKVGIIGGEGDGKTYTAVQIAMGLHAELKARGLPEGNNPIAFLESSEFGLDFLIPQIVAATGHKPIARKTGAFKNFVEAMRVAIERKVILVVDSTTAFYEELREAYRAQVGGRELAVEDLGAINRYWAEAMELFKNGAFHCILTGRRGWEWGHFENEATGRRELERTDVKMKGGPSTGYECSLLIHMKRAADTSDPIHPRIFRVATIFKDRAQVIDGMSFDNPTYANFRGHFLALDLGGTHRGIDGDNSAGIIVDPRTGRNRWEEKQVLLDEIDALLAYEMPGQDGASKKARAEALDKNFGTLSKDRLGTLHLDFLRRGYNRLHLSLKGVAPVLPADKVNGEDGDRNDPMSVAMRALPNGKMVTVEEYGRITGIRNVGPARTDKDAAEPHKLTGAKDGTANGNGADIATTPVAPAVQPPAPANAEAPAKKRPGRPKKNPAPPAEPAPASAPVALAPVVDLSVANIRPPEGDEKEPAPAPGTTNPDAVLAEATAPPDATAAPVKRKPGRPRKNPAPEPSATPADATAAPATPAEAPAAGEAPKPKRGRPPGSKNKPKAEDAPAAPAPAPIAGMPAPEAPATPAPTVPMAADGQPVDMSALAPSDPLANAVEAPAPVSPTVVTIKNAGDFMAYAPAEAAKHGISAPQFSRGLQATLALNKFLGVPRESLPEEFLADFFDAIRENRWDTETGIFRSADAALPAEI